MRLEPLEFVDTWPGLAIFLLIVLCIASLLGTLGNVLILVSVATQKELQNVESVFIVNLAMCDLYVTVLADPLSIVAKTVGWRWFDSVPYLCRAVGSLCTISCVGSLMTLSAMSFNRYVLICRPSLYPRLFTLRHSIAMCASVYTVGLLLVLLNLAGVGDHTFDHKSLECIWDRMANHNYTIVFAIVLVWIPIVITGLSYIHIYLHVRASRKRVHNHSSVNVVSSMAQKDEVSRQDGSVDRDFPVKKTPSEYRDKQTDNEYPPKQADMQHSADGTNHSNGQLDIEEASQANRKLNEQANHTTIEKSGLSDINCNDSGPKADDSTAASGSEHRQSLATDEERTTFPKEGIKLDEESDPATKATIKRPNNSHVNCNTNDVRPEMLAAENNRGVVTDDKRTLTPKLPRSVMFTSVRPAGSTIPDEKEDVVDKELPTSDSGQSKSLGQRLRGTLGSLKKRNLSPTLRLARTLFIIYLVFSACWLPYSFILILDAQDSFAHELHVVIVAWAHLHPSINWLVYYYTNSKFRKAFRKLLRIDRHA
ncbi:hypothetical protein C0Q70_15389 [Pomacea canaliculata]|uniref:G-protein coupled receptors family 1 profile domain-containing protein n=1 Tax=Pomacea canaliculata TaxID=400727 RepID=A0A2T7NUN8_POMCA|nr:muscarinic acetylcholine receptor M2-like [Pomacea canaliculata]PVD24898.1 hypothetical protein C0Q70_15389 [Pomacea canaliculata]